MSGSSNDSIRVFVFMLISKCFTYYSSVVHFQITDGDSPIIYFIIHDYFSYSGILAIPHEPEDYPFWIHEELCWMSDGDYIESVECF